MHQPLQLQIAEPCHENWNQMTAQAQGRFCGSCQKTVVDFTNMSDSQLLEYFKNYNSNTCGRFENHQLDRVLAIPLPAKPSWYKWAFAMLFSGFLFSSKAKAQGFIRVIEKNVNQPLLKGKVQLKAQPKEKSHEVKGIVVDENGIGIPYASVLVKSQRWGVSADSLGHFTIHVKTSDDIMVLSCSSVGYIEKEWVINLRDESKAGISINLIKKAELDNVVVTGYAYQRRTDVTGTISIIVGAVSRKQDIERRGFIDGIGKNPIGAIFPNPAKAGSQVTIPFKQNGNYSARMLDVGGRMLLAKGGIQIQSPQNYTIQIPMQAAAGQYFIQILNANGKIVATEKIVVIH